MTFNICIHCHHMLNPEFNFVKICCGHLPKEVVKENNLCHFSMISVSEEVLMEELFLRMSLTNIEICEHLLTD